MFTGGYADAPCLTKIENLNFTSTQAQELMLLSPFIT